MEKPKSTLQVDLSLAADELMTKLQDEMGLDRAQLIRVMMVLLKISHDAAKDGYVCGFMKVADAEQFEYYFAELASLRLVDNRTSDTTVSDNRGG